MPISVDYVARETTSNLWRNRLLTLAAILTVAVSLSLVGSTLVVRQAVNRVSTQWQHGVNVLVFLNPLTPAPAAPTAQQAAIAGQLRQLPYVHSCAYKTQQFDYDEAGVVLGQDVRDEGLTVASTPASLRCVLNDPNQLQAIINQFHAYPGVQAVRGPTQAVKQIQKLIRIGQWVLFSVALVLLLSASVLILNTIRLAIFARRREVAVMKVVGATNWFIRVPFMCEGLVQGLAGALLAVGVVAIVVGFIDNASVQWHVPLGQVGVSCFVVALIGVVIGAAGSYLGIRRFLDA